MDQTKGGNVAQIDESPLKPTNESGRGIITIDEELEFHSLVRDICTKAGIPAEDIVYRDTVNYFNISYKKPWKWFVRFFGDSKRMNIITLVPVEEAQGLAQGFDVEPAPSMFGVSRVFVGSVAQASALKELILRSLELFRSKDTP